MLKEISIILPLHNKGHIIEKTIDQIFNSVLFEWGRALGRSVCHVR